MNGLRINHATIGREKDHAIEQLKGMRVLLQTGQQQKQTAEDALREYNAVREGLLSDLNDTHNRNAILQATSDKRALDGPALERKAAEAEVKIGQQLEKSTKLQTQLSSATVKLTETQGSLESLTSDASRLQDSVQSAN